jgi:pimeloyl-ACP methyl ester carboxylesterase
LVESVHRRRRVTASAFGRTAASVAVILAMGATSAVAAPQSSRQTANPKWGDGGVSSFYTWTGKPAAKPGVMLRTEPLPENLLIPGAASGQRILYSSTDGVTGKGGVVVSGAYFTPKGTPPTGGWPLIAWAHGTVGMADICAPSWAGRGERDMRYLGTWLANGFAVVATDYQGLGTPGPHPYIETRPEAYSVLDSVRAVQAGEPNLSKKVIVVGQSQGAGAAFATAAFASAYAPDLDIRGTVATGTPNLSPKNFATASNTDLDRVDPTIAYAYYLTLTAQAERPSVKMSDSFTEKALPLVEIARTQCVGALFKAVSDAKLTRREALRPENTTLIFGPMMASLGYPTLKLKGPIFMGAGAADKDVNPAGQMELAKDACAAGTVVEAHLYEGLDHSATVNGSLPDSLPFVKKALAGEPITPRCDAAPEKPKG